MKESTFTEKDVVAELGEIVAGSVKTEVYKSRLSLFKSVGNAVQDLAVAAVVYERLKK